MRWWGGGGSVAVRSARARLAGALPGGRAAEHGSELGGHARRVAEVVARARRRAPVRVGVVTLGSEREPCACIS